MTQTVSRAHQVTDQAAAARTAPGLDLSACLTRLAAGFAAFDIASARAVLDAALEHHTVEEVLREVCFPYLRWLGDEWEAGRVTIAQEHHASGLLREWLTSLDRSLDHRQAPTDAPQNQLDRSRGDRPRAVLACTPHERHDIGLVGLRLVLERAGWQVIFLGADTPVEDAVSMTLASAADVLVLAGTEPHMFRAHLAQHAETLRGLGTTACVAIGGPAALPGVGDLAGALSLAPDPVLAAVQLTDVTSPAPGATGRVQRLVTRS